MTTDKKELRALIRQRKRQLTESRRQELSFAINSLLLQHPHVAGADAETGCAYKGAKEGYILDFRDRQKVLKVIERLWEELPFPKSRKK